MRKRIYSNAEHYRTHAVRKIKVFGYFCILMTYRHSAIALRHALTLMRDTRGTNFWMEYSLGYDVKYANFLEGLRTFQKRSHNKRLGAITFLGDCIWSPCDIRDRYRYILLSKLRDPGRVWQTDFSYGVTINKGIIGLGLGKGWVYLS